MTEDDGVIMFLIGESVQGVAQLVHVFRIQCAEEVEWPRGTWVRAGDTIVISTNESKKSDKSEEPFLTTHPQPQRNISQTRFP